MNINVNANNYNNGIQNANAINTSAEKNTGNIKADSLKLADDSVAQRRAEAQKKAMKIIGDAYAGEKKIDDDVAARRDRVRELSSELGENKKALKDLEDKRAALRDEYGVDPDSQEEKDLQLLAKAKESKFEGSNVYLTPEERKKVEELEAGGLTEYQEKSLELKEYESPYYTASREAENEIRTENAIIRGIKIERLKTHPMLDAEKQAEEVMDEANKEIAQMVVDAAKDHIEEEQEKEKEKAEAEKKKEEEVQEKIDSAKEKRKEQEELTEDIVENAQTLTNMTNKMESAQQEVKDLMNKLKLVEEDVKGAKVDKGV